MSGWQARDVPTRCSGELQLAPKAPQLAAEPLGLALGYGACALAELLPAGDAWMIAAFNERLVPDAD